MSIQQYLRDFRRLAGPLYEAPEPPPEFVKAMKGVEWSDYRRTLSGHAFQIDDDTSQADLEKRFPGHNISIKGKFGFVGGKKTEPKPLPKGVHSSWEDQARARAKRDKVEGELVVFKWKGRNYAVVMKDGKIQISYRMRRDGRAATAAHVIGPDNPGLVQALQ